MNGTSCRPPYTVGDMAISRIADIVAALERRRLALRDRLDVRLRKANHEKTIRGIAALFGERIGAVRGVISSLHGCIVPFVYTRSETGPLSMVAKGRGSLPPATPLPAVFHPFGGGKEVAERAKRQPTGDKR